jgi:predicted transcriptional regulator
MEVRLSPELEAELARMAAEQGRTTETLVQEAVQRYLDYDKWFRAEVEKGLQAAERGEFVDDEEVRRMIDRLCPE